jgi:hypothetical protein
MVSISSCAFGPLGLLPLKILCSVLLPISSLGHWFFGSLVFWAPCIFWLLIQIYSWIINRMYTWQRFSPILWAASSIWWPFLLLCRSFSISCMNCSFDCCALYLLTQLSFWDLCPSVHGIYLSSCSLCIKKKFGETHPLRAPWERC